MKSFRGALLIVFLITIISCGKNPQKPSAQVEEKKSVPVVIKIAHSNNPDEPNGIAAQEWADRANNAGGDRLKVEVYPNSQLGSQKDVMEQVLVGANIVSISDAGFLMDYVPDIGILYAPYLTDTYEDYFRVIDSDWFQNEIIPEVRQSGFEIVTAKWVYGTRHILADKPVLKPADMAGLKLRTPNMQLLVKTINYMGGIATPMPLADVYSAVAQGTIAGAENPIPVLYGTKIYESVKHLSLTGHVKNVSIWIGSSKFFADMDPELVRIFKDAADQTALETAKTSIRNDEEYLEKMEQNGVQVHEVDVPAFKAAVQPLYKELFSYDLVQKVKSIAESK